MHKFLWVFTFTIVCSVNSLYVKAQFSDDFSDGNFAANPTWSGSDSKFIVYSGELKLQAPTAGNAYLSTTSEAVNDATWQFSVRLDFNPSASNYARVYLMSDKPDLSAALNGYFVMVGDTPDEISLYRQTGATRTKIIDGADGRIGTSTVAVSVKVTRDTDGNWELFSNVGPSGNYVSEGKQKEATHLSSSSAGVYCAFTATRSDKFFFDNFIVTGEKAPVKTIAQPILKDVIITELFADPAPRVNLPEYEYVEIYNRSSQEFNLAGWQLSDGTSVGRLPGKVIKPGQYVILTSTSGAGAFSGSGDVIGIPSFPSLNNVGDAITLKAGSLTVDSVNYSDEWYRDAEKKQGGCSLELIDPENKCSGQDNWIASEDDNGGTPGKQNSVYANKPDLTGPMIVSATALSSRELKIVFNETLNKVLPPAQDFIVTPSVGCSSVSFFDNALKSLRLTLSEELATGTTYAIQAATLSDCSGNVIQPEFDGFEFGLPEDAVSGDVVINEILFNPKSPGEDFVEIYNLSLKFINLKNWSVSSLDGDSIVNKKTITTEDLLLPPNTYMALTPDVASLKGQYIQAHEKNLFRVTLPSMPDDQGSAALLDAGGFIQDYFLYNEDMHSPFISNREGVSLERISFSEPTNERENWKSGTAPSNYATPGYVNSNARLAFVSDDGILISPEIFQPVYGQPDFTQIQYRFDQGGWVANIKICDGQGRQVKEIANNESLPTEGFFQWNGDQDDGTKAKIGYYFVWFQAFDVQGNVRTYRKRVVVAGSF